MRIIPIIQFLLYGFSIAFIGLCIFYLGRYTGPKSEAVCAPQVVIERQARPALMQVRLIAPQGDAVIPLYAKALQPWFTPAQRKVMHGALPLKRRHK